MELESPLYPALEGCIVDISKWIGFAKSKVTYGKFIIPTVEEQVEHHILPEIEKMRDYLIKEDPEDALITDLAIAYALALIAPGSAHAKITLELLKDRSSSILHAAVILGLVYLGTMEETIDTEVVKLAISEKLLAHTPQMMLRKIFTRLESVLSQNPSYRQTLASQIKKLNESMSVEFAIGLMRAGEINKEIRQILATKIYYNDRHELTPAFRKQADDLLQAWVRLAEQYLHIWDDLIHTLMVAWEEHARGNDDNRSVSSEQLYACATVLKNVNPEYITETQFNQLIQLYEHTIGRAVPLVQARYLALIVKCANGDKYRLVARSYISSLFDTMERGDVLGGVFKGIWELTQPDTELLDKVFAFASGDGFLAKGWAIETLGEWQINDPMVITVITEALNNDDYLVRGHAKKALEKINTDN